MMKVFPASIRIRVLLLATFLTAAIDNSSASGAKPGELYEWAVPGTKPAVAIRFRLCPSGEIQPGKPVPGSGPAGAGIGSNVVKLREFYLTETEITLKQFRAVLGAKATAPMLERAKKLSKANPQLLSVLQSGQDEPVYLVGLESAVLFSTNVQTKSNTAQAETGKQSIQTFRFRLPTHTEWQYAARGIPTLAEQGAHPHFNRWVKKSQLTPASAQKCDEVWATVGQGAFPDIQESYLQMASASSAADAAKVKDILRECFEKAFKASRNSASGVGAISAVGQTLPNEWQLYDMHDNVTEWVLAVTTERTAQTWQEMSSKVQAGETLQNQGGVFLAGGCFADTYEGAGALAKFTIWGGPKLGEGKSPQPFEYTEEVVLDTYPGFRVLMERSIRDDWLFALRSGLFTNRRLNTTAAVQLAESQKLLTELADKDHPAWMSILFYQALLAQAGGHPTPEATTLLTQFVAASSVSKPVKKKSILEAFATQDTPAASDAAVDVSQLSDDQLYWQAFQQLIAEK